MKPIFLSVLLLCAWATAAQENPAPPAEDIFDRLTTRLVDIPQRWESLPAPRIPASGRSIEEVLGAASEEQAQAAMQWISRLSSSSSAEQAGLIEAELQQRAPTEVDLWLPGYLAQLQQTESSEEAARTLEAWLQLAWTLGRKDTLLFAASRAIDILRLRRNVQVVLPIAQTWTALPQVPGAERSRALLQSSLANVLFRLGDHQKALDAYRNSRQLFVAIDSQLGQGNTWKGEADVLFRLGDNQRALDAYRNARQIFAALGSQLGQGSTWLGEADVLFLFGDNQKALEAYRNARQLFVAADDPLGQGNTWKGEADILFRLGDLRKALDIYRATKQLFIALEEPLGQGNTWKGEADILFLLGNDQKALDAYRNARQIFVAAGDQLGEGNTWRGEADVLFRLGDHQKALDAYRNAKQLFVAAGSRLGQGNAWSGEADVLLRLGDTRKALDTYRNARQLYIAIEEPIGQANTWLGEAQALQEDGDWEGVAEAATTAITKFQSAGTVSGQISAFLLKARAENQTGDLEAAARSAAEAIRLHSQRRKTWITDRHRTDQEETISQVYDFLVPLRAQQANQAAEALRLAEEARSRVLLDLLATPPSRGESVPSVDLMAERQRLEAETWQIEERLRNTSDPSRQEDLRARRRQLDQDLEWNRYQRIAAQEESFPEAPPLDTAAIQTLARETGPLLLYYAAEREVWGFLILPGSADIAVHPIPLVWGELGREVRSLAHDLANPLYEPRAAAQARKLWDLLIAPFSERIPAGGPLVLVPHGSLHELPFEALLDPAGKPLFERWRLSVTPSVSALSFARRRHVPRAQKDSFLAFSSGQGLNLPVEEVAEISGFFGSNKAAFRPTEARYQSYEKLVTQARHLLIATRGVHTEGSRTETYLEIQPTPEVHDSRLTAAEIATIPLQAELVTLAACDTSHGRALLSDERLDLTRSFLIAGAAAVLATRWKVPENASTSRFLTDFYRAYRQGGPQGAGMRKDEALTEARRRSRERGDPAQVWAAWVLVGDGR